MTKKNLAGFNRSAAIYGSYDAGDVSVSAEPTVVTPVEQVQQLLIYPTVDCRVKLNESDKEIFVPKNAWTPISVVCDMFTLIAEGEGTAHWQGWVI